MKKVVISIVIAVAVVVVVGFVPLVGAEYRYTETYNEDEPYEVTETYTETEPLEYQILNRQYGIAMENLPIGVEPSCPYASITVLNTDTASGTFIVHFYLTVECLIPIGEDTFSFASNDYQDSKELYLEPGKIGTLEKYWVESDYVGDRCDIDAWSDDITPDTKQVEKERTVTKYRQVEKERLVFQYNRVPIFEYLRSRF